MDVYLAMRADEAPMFHAEDDALMVFLAPEDAQREVEELGEPAFVAEIDSATVAQRLRETGYERVITVLGEDEAYSGPVDEWERHMAEIGAGLEGGDRATQAGASIQGHW